MRTFAVVAYLVAFAYIVTYIATELRGRDPTYICEFERVQGAFVVQNRELNRDDLMIVVKRDDRTIMLRRDQLRQCTKEVQL